MDHLSALNLANDVIEAGFAIPYNDHAAASQFDATWRAELDALSAYVHRTSGQLSRQLQRGLVRPENAAAIIAAELLTA